MAVNDMRDYLLPLNISKEDKRYVLNFCKKLEYIDGLGQHAAKTINQPIELGHGNINSKICFIFRDKKRMKDIKGVLQTHLDDFNLNLWDVWITFVDKASPDYNDKYTFLAYELNAINPFVIYIFDDDYSTAKLTEQAVESANCSNLQHCFYIDTNSLSKDDAKKVLWSQFRFLINYQTLDIKE